MDFLIGERRKQKYKESLLMDWISVKDRLPEEGQAEEYVVIYYWTMARNSTETDIAIYSKSEGWEIKTSVCHQKTDDVIYWMPLPSSPKE